MDIKVYFANGDIATHKVTFLSYPDGYVIESDYLHLEIDYMEQHGLILDRAAFLDDIESGPADENQTDGHQAKELQPKNILVPSELIPQVLAINVDGEMVIQRTTQGLVNLILAAFALPTEDLAVQNST